MYYDAESKMYLVGGNRYYSPVVRQCLSPDNSNLDVTEIYGLNPYIITLTNPVNMIYTGYTIETAIPLAFDPPEMTRWQRFWEPIGQAFNSFGNWFGGTRVGRAINSFFNWWNDLHWGWQLGIGAVVIAALALATIFTGGAAGGVAGFILAGALKGATISAGVGLGVGAGMGLIGTAISGDWSNVGMNILNNAAGGFALGAVGGAIFGGVGAGIKVGKAAKLWQSGTSVRTATSFKTMVHHYKIHGQGFGNIVNYSKQASNFAIRNANSLSFVARNAALTPHWTWIGKAGMNGHFTSSGKILTFWMF